MNKKDLTELALRSLTEDISESERKIIDSELIVKHSFGSGFRDRVMNSISSGSVLSLFDYSSLRIFNRVFNRLALTGMIAIILLAITLFVSQGSLSFDTLIGMDSEVDEVMLSLLIE